MSRTAFIIHGNTSNRQRLIERIKNLFGTGQDNVETFVTEYAGHAVLLAKEAVVMGFENIICAGGDGSLNEVVNGLMNAKQKLSDEGWAKIRVGVLPVGTGNDFVKTIKSPSTIEGLKAALEKDSYLLTDVGLVHFTGKSGKPESRYFINITDVGMGGVAAEKLSRTSKWMGPTLTYQRVILSTLLRYKNQPVSVKADTFSYEGRIMNLIIANGKYFGSGLGIAPDAEVNDGLFAIVVIGEVSLLDYAKNLGNIQNCRKVVHPQLLYKTAREIVVDSPAGPMAIDMDGEFIGYSPMQVQVIHSALKFVV